MASKVPASTERPTGSRKSGYLIRLDDMAPNMRWPEYFRAKKLFCDFGVRPVLGVIPNNEDPELKLFPECVFNFWDEIRDVQARGWTIAMHGYRHVYDSSGDDILGMRDKSEFAGHDLAVQLERLELSKAVFDREGVHVDCFFAPSHTFDVNTLEGLKQIGVTSIFDGYGLFPFSANGMLFVPQLVGRPIAFPYGVHTSVHHLNNYLERDFVALERFVEKNHQKILSYPEAEALVRDDVWNRAWGVALKKSLQAKRRVSRWVNASLRSRPVAPSA